MSPFGASGTKETALQYNNKEKLYYDVCHAAPVLEWMSQKWALVAMKRIAETTVIRKGHGPIVPNIEPN